MRRRELFGLLLPRSGQHSTAQGRGTPRTGRGTPRTLGPKAMGFADPVRVGEVVQRFQRCRCDRVGFPGCARGLATLGYVLQPLRGNRQPDAAKSRTVIYRPPVPNPLHSLRDRV